MIDVAILGSTGSIGASTLRLVERHPELFRVVALAARSSVDRLAEQVERYRPEIAVVTDPDALAGRDDPLPEADWRTGREALLEVAAADGVDVVVNAIVGAAGLEPTLVALRAEKRLALANKESLVAGGPLVVEAARSGSGELVPVDSEHSAILQCLHGAREEEVRRIVLTASGGPFRGWDRSAIREATPSQALQHPTWDMGAKITVDSATLANKALEVIETHFLYEMSYDAIDVVVHPQSVVHSFVEFIDGSVLAQAGFPTMELPILYALSWPRRVADEALRTFDPVAASPLTFEEVDRQAFPLFGLGVDAGRTGGSAPAVFNAANEIAVAAFLQERVSFGEMARIVESALERLDARPLETVDDVLEADRAAREVAREAVGAPGSVPGS